MNVAFFLTPKSEVSFLYSDFTVRQGLEKMKQFGFTAVPVIDREGKYVSTVGEGDFLWYILQDDAKRPEDTPLKDILKKDKNPPASITASAKDLINRAIGQNFVPVTDDEGTFIGIVTRRDVIRNFAYSFDDGDLDTFK